MLILLTEFDKPILSSRACKFLKKKKKDKNTFSLYNRLRSKIDEIWNNPYSFDELTNQKPYKKARVGDYRIIFLISDKKICIVDINHRKKIYKNIYKPF